MNLHHLSGSQNDISKGWGGPCAEDVDLLVELIWQEDFVWEGGESEVKVVFYCTLFETGGFRETGPDIGEVLF